VFVDWLDAPPVVGLPPLPEVDPLLSEPLVPVVPLGAALPPVVPLEPPVLLAADELSAWASALSAVATAF
jgi:hypothetical protein